MNCNYLVFPKHIENCWFYWSSLGLKVVANLISCNLHGSDLFLDPIGPEIPSSKQTKNVPALLIASELHKIGHPCPALWNYWPCDRFEGAFPDVKSV